MCSPVVIQNSQEKIKPAWPATGAGRSLRKDGDARPTMPSTLRLHCASILVSSNVPCLCSLQNEQERILTRQAAFWLSLLPRSWCTGFPPFFPLTKLEPKEPSSVHWLFSSFPTLPDVQIPSVSTLPFPSHPSKALLWVVFLNSGPGLFSPSSSHLPMTTIIFLRQPGLPRCRFQWLFFIRKTNIYFPCLDISYLRHLTPLPVCPHFSLAGSTIHQAFSLP